MRRRTLLTALSTGVAALSGCSTSTGDPSNATAGTTTDSPEDRPSQTPESDGRTESRDPKSWDLGSASVVDLEIANRTYALAPTNYYSDDRASVAVRFTDTATANSPATVEATLTNENAFENTFRLDWTPPFGRRSSDPPSPMGEEHGDYTYSDGMVFAPTENHDLVDDSPPLERGPDGYWRLASRSSQEFPERIRLAPEETVYGEYVVVGQVGGTGRGRVPGVYEFSRAGSRSLRITVWETDEPGPEGESRFVGPSVPSLHDESDTAWYHDADARTSTFVRPSVERTQLPARLEFTFINRSHDATNCGHWNFYKLEDGEWFHLGPYVHTADCRSVAPGGTKTWAIRVANGEMAPCRARSFPYLGGGRYAAVAGYGHATGQSGALVEFDAPAVSLTPTDDVTVQREGGQVTVTSQRWRDAPVDDSNSRVAVILESATATERTVIAEQVLRDRYRGMRNTLAFAAPDVDRVVLRTNERTADRAVGRDEQAENRVEYNGQAYRLTRERRES